MAGGMLSRFSEKKDDSLISVQEDAAREEALVNTGKPFWSRLWPVIACGAGLFSDGYINNVIGSVNTMIGTIYPSFATSPARVHIGAIAFAGTVVGQLFFGWTSDRWSRTNSLMVSTIILFVFAALSAGAYGGGTVSGLAQALTAYRFLVGIGIGGEYPAGSVSCAEATGELKAGTRNRWFALMTNQMIDWGFVVGAFVPYILVVICTESHLRAAWRISLGLGCIPPLSLIFIRMRLKEPEAVRRESMRKGTKIPYWLIIKFYGGRLAAVSAIWFLYDFSSYSFGIYSTSILNNIPGSSATLATTFGWNTVINLFYIPGAIAGAFLSDYLGPRYTLALGVTLQAVFGFIMAGCYDYFNQASRVGGFAVMYGIFLSLGELGPGDNIGLLAAKTSATSVRGQYYGIAAAIGKIGAFVGTYVFPYIEAAGGSNTTATAQYPFYVSSALCVVSAVLALTCLPHVGQDTITHEDARFRAYLTLKGWDVSQMGDLLIDAEKEGSGRGSGEEVEAVAPVQQK